MSMQSKWFTACLADWQNSAGQAREYADIQLQELRQCAALIIAGEFSAIYTRSQADKSHHPFAHTVDDDSALAKWHGIQTDTLFSGVIIRYADQSGEEVVVGRCYS